MANSVKKSPPSPKIANRGNTRLSVFIRENSKQIGREWSKFAKTLTPAANDMTELALRDHIEKILTFIADDLESPQTGPEQVKKSHGDGPKEKAGGGKCSTAEIHAALRLDDRFDIDQMVAEYRALRASVVKLWRADNHDLSDTDLTDLTRFNESIDQEMTESIAYYTKTIDHSRNMFLGILGHDLRNPIGAASMSAELISTLGTLNEKQTKMATQITNSTARANQIIADLLDLTRAGFGSDLPVIKAPMDMGIVSKELVDEMNVFHFGHEITLEIEGNPQGEWDKARIGQILSNLIGNAIQYSFPDTPIKVTVKGKPDEIILSVHNEGQPIPRDKTETIFDSLTRVTREQSEEQMGSTNLGLGLYITKKIVVAHGGTIGVTSTEKGGTTFTAKFPRH